MVQIVAEVLESPSSEFPPGSRVGVSWVGGTDGTCKFCTSNRENICDNPTFTGYTHNGGFAEYTTHHVSALYPMPPHLTFEDAVLIMTAGTSMYGLDAVGGYVAGESVVVIGPGPVGLMAVQACKALGADPVILVGTRQSRLDLGARLGAVYGSPTGQRRRICAATSSPGLSVTDSRAVGCRASGVATAS